MNAKIYQYLVKDLPEVEKVPSSKVVSKNVEPKSHKGRRFQQERKFKFDLRSSELA